MIRNRIELQQERRSCSRRGFTLVEVMIALLVFAFCVAGMCALLTMVKETSDRSRDHYVAINVCKNRIERARAFDFSQLGLFAEINVLVNRNGLPVPSSNYRRTTVVTNVSAELVEMSVTVDIRDRESLQFDGVQEKLESYIANIQGPPE